MYIYIYTHIYIYIYVLAVFPLSCRSGLRLGLRLNSSRFGLRVQVVERKTEAYAKVLDGTTQGLGFRVRLGCYPKS